MKWIIIAIVAVALLVGGGVSAYFIMKDDEKPATSQTVSDSGSESTASINDLFSGDKKQKCTYSYTDPQGVASTGTAYFSGNKKMYGEFKTVGKDGGVSQAQVIRNGDTQYVWQKDATTGYKADVSAYDQQKQEEMSAQLDPEKNYQFKCVAWQVDESLFTAPASVKFQDFSAQLKAAGSEKLDDLKQQACAALTDPAARAKCEAAL